MKSWIKASLAGLLMLSVPLGLLSYMLYINPWLTGAFVVYFLGSAWLVCVVTGMLETTWSGQKLRAISAGGSGGVVAFFAGLFFILAYRYTFVANGVEFGGIWDNFILIFCGWPFYVLLSMGFATAGSAIVYAIFGGVEGLAITTSEINRRNRGGPK